MRVLLMLLSLFGVAFGHAPSFGESGFVSGFFHPINGLDHVLAMVGVGVVAFFASKRGYFLLFAFMAAMLVSAILGFMGVGVPFVEEGILLSIAVIFALIGFAKKIPLGAIVAVVAFFGLFHGFAHGSEFQSGSFAAYMAGFTLSTLFLHLSGIALAYAYMKNAPKEAAHTVEK